MRYYGMLCSIVGVLVLFWAAFEAGRLGESAQIAWAILGAAFFLCGGIVSGLAAIADRMDEGGPNRPSDS